jgi:hypothetical protein
MKKQKTHILMLEKDDSKRELEFEVEFQLSLTAIQKDEKIIPANNGFCKKA